MKLIIESGSTNSQWAWKTDKIYFSHQNGLNPLTVEKDTFLETIRIVRNKMGEFIPQEILFFGAGCGNLEGNRLARNYFLVIFPTAKVSIFSDVEASSIAFGNTSEALSGILGTGSNLAYYFDGNLEGVRPSLGYLTGDSGSGCYFGKMLLRDYFSGRIPSHILTKIQSRLPDYDEYLQNCYRESHANRYLASFCVLLQEIRESEYTQDILKTGFQGFFYEQNIPQNLPKTLNFVGSVAYNFRRELEEVAKENGYIIGECYKTAFEKLILSL